MLEAILEAYQLTDYDFRETANPADPLQHRFGDWVDYYRLKYAIAQVLQPQSILEIGVRFGYSAIAFLKGYPQATYLGIDNDSDTHGGVKGAFHWAQKITQGMMADYLIADSQEMPRFPGGLYDLIHVDGQQDGDGSFRDLEKAIRQGRYVLVDGYLWTRQNFLAISDFLLRNASYFDWFATIPGYAGELLIKVSPQFLATQHPALETKDSSLAIQNTYTTEYYIQDCGGFEAYTAFGGKRLADLRLQAVASIATVKAPGRVLDLGCGRGELTYHFAKQGAQVTAIDYSQDAIDLVHRCFRDEPELEQRVNFYCADVCTVELLPQEKNFDLAVAADIIEHLTPQEVDRLYQRVSQWLNRDGVFVVHTSPNLWFYQYEYARRRKLAASIGAYLPPEPRSRYELLMHINEQSPRVLKRQLSQHFKHVLLWFGSDGDPGGSLTRPFSRWDACAAPSLYAVASQTAIPLKEVQHLFNLTPLPPEQVRQSLRITARDYPAHVTAGSLFEIPVEVANYGSSALSSTYPNPLKLSYHWLDGATGQPVIFEGMRTALWPFLGKAVQLPSGEVRPGQFTYNLRVETPQQAGRYILRITFVQEFVQWLDDSSFKHPVYEDQVIQVEEAG